MDALPKKRAFGNKIEEDDDKDALKPSTRNRYLSTIRKLLNDCASWEWTDRDPNRPKEDEPEKRVRWITQAEALSLLAAIHMDWFRVQRVA